MSEIKRVPGLSKFLFFIRKGGWLLWLLLLPSCHRFTTPPHPPGVPEAAVRDRKTGIWKYQAGGVSRSFYGDGTLAEKGQFKGVARTGEWFTYLPGGKIVASKGLYNEDWRDGTWLFNDDEGKLYLSVDYRLRPRREFLLIYTHDYGNENGPYRRYYDDGSLEEEGAFYSGFQEGSLVRYYKNGRVALKGSFRKDKKSGTWLAYYPDGVLQSKELYQEGLLEGPYFSFYPDGTLYFETRYEKGREVGPRKIRPPR